MITALVMLTALAVTILWAGIAAAMRMGRPGRLPPPAREGERKGWTEYTRH